MIKLFEFSTARTKFETFKKTLTKDCAEELPGQRVNIEQYENLTVLRDSPAIEESKWRILGNSEMAGKNVLPDFVLKKPLKTTKKMLWFLKIPLKALKNR